MKSGERTEYGWRATIGKIIFESDTPAGKAFDVGLILCILVSVAAVMLDSIKTVRNVHGNTLYLVEWLFTILFTVEYILRLLTSRNPIRYARSFFGMVDMVAVLPTYLSFIFPGTQYLIVIRILRVLRVFRVLKYVKYIEEAFGLMSALRASARKITVFLCVIITLVVILGSLMYLIEGEENGFTSIPLSVYWAIVTLTTVGYGDLSPRTPLGQGLASVIMIIGYSIIAVPTGILTAEMTRTSMKKTASMRCIECGRKGHDEDALYCKHCGGEIMHS